MKSDGKVSRRNFVRTMVGSAAFAGITGKFKPLKALAAVVARKSAMPTRALGRTGHSVGLFSLGGQATLEQDGRTDDAIYIINRAIDLGVNYIDTAAAYGRGKSETYIGRVMKTL